MRAPSRPAPALTRIGSPLRVAPPPCVGEKQLVGRRREHRSQPPAARLRPARRRSTSPRGRRYRRACRRSDRPPRRAARASRAGSFSLSSDSQPSPGQPGSRSRSRSFDRDVRLGNRRIARALGPALEGAAKKLQRDRAGLPHRRDSRSRSAARDGSDAGNGQPLHPQRRRVGAVAELQIVGRRQRCGTCRAYGRRSSPRSPDRCARRSRSRSRQRRGCSRR